MGDPMAESQHLGHHEVDDGEEHERTQQRPRVAERRAQVVQAELRGRQRVGELGAPADALADGTATRPGAVVGPREFLVLDRGKQRRSRTFVQVLVALRDVLGVSFADELGPLSSSAPWHTLTSSSIR